MNPIEELIAKLRLLGQPSDAGDESQEWTYRKCADLLEAAINPYRRVPGPPTDEGWHWVKTDDVEWVCYVFDDDIANGEMWSDDELLAFDRIQWHALVMPPFGEGPNE